LIKKVANIKRKCLLIYIFFVINNQACMLAQCNSFS